MSTTPDPEKVIPALAAAATAAFEAYREAAPVDAFYAFTQDIVFIKNNSIGFGTFFGPAMQSTAAGQMHLASVVKALDFCVSRAALTRDFAMAEPLVGILYQCIADGSKLALPADRTNKLRRSVLNVVERLNGFISDAAKRGQVVTNIRAVQSQIVKLEGWP